jgi:hypothetical protein
VTTLDKDAVGDLKRSIEAVGQIYGVIACKQHPDRILSGKHRMATGLPLRDPYPLDVDARAKAFRYSHGLMELLIQVKSNTQRKVSEEERRQEFVAIAEQLEKDGTPKDKVARRIVEVLGFSESYALSLLPSQFKQQQKAVSPGRPVIPRITDQPQAPQADEAVKDTPVPSVEVGQAEKPVPRQAFSKGTSPTASRFAVKTFKPAAVRFASLLKEAGVKDAQLEVEFPREGELTEAGKPKFYSADIAVKTALVVLEVEGEGSASKDDPERDASFGRKGFIVLHVSTGLVKDYGAEVSELLASLIVDRSRRIAESPDRGQPG